MQSLHYVTLLEELRAKLLAHAKSATEPGLSGGQAAQNRSPYPEEPKPTWSSAAPDPIANASNVYRAEGK